MQLLTVNIYADFKLAANALRDIDTVLYTSTGQVLALSRRESGVAIYLASGGVGTTVASDFPNAVGLTDSIGVS